VSVKPVSEAHVWRVDLDRAEGPVGELSAAEERRAAAIVRPLARRRWIAARRALRGVLGECLGRDPAVVEIHAAPGGKPYVEGAGDLRFNLSHSGGLALIAICRGREVGVDVERIGGRPRSFYEAWARREALAKCFGTGLGGSLPNRPVELHELDPGGGWVAALALGGPER
jgi:4'-phosphopantetheinyl transferase